VKIILPTLPQGIFLQKRVALIDWSRLARFAKKARRDRLRAAGIKDRIMHRRLRYMPDCRAGRSAPGATHKIEPQ
jgi:hypothetical protein